MRHVRSFLVLICFVFCVFAQGLSCPAEDILEYDYDNRQCGADQLDPIHIRKWEKKRISWTGSMEEVQLEGFGRCGKMVNCFGEVSSYEYWPEFMTPEVSAGQWSQRVIGKVAECVFIGCGFGTPEYRCTPRNLDPRVFQSEGVCITSGGSEGGDESGGCTPYYWHHDVYDCNADYTDCTLLYSYEEYAGCF